MLNHNERDRRLVRDIAVVFIANIIRAFFNVLLNFSLPKYLTVNAYAGIKTYELYYTYVGIFHFGFADGVYLEYGGKEFKQINAKDMAIRLSSFHWLEIVSTAVLLLISLFWQDNIFFFFVLSVPMLNIIGYFQLLYLATGEYSLYSKILNATTLGKTVISLLLLIFVSKKNYTYYLIGYVLLDLGIVLWLEISLYKRKTKGHTLAALSIPLIINEIKSGFALRLGDISGFFLSGMDRVFVKAMMNTVAFAQYSFAATVENLLNIMITPVTTTLYNYFCNSPSKTQLHKGRNIIMIISLMILVFFFPIKFIVETYLNEYASSLIVLAFLFVSKSLYMIIQGVYVNLYKAQKQKNKYLTKLLIVIFIGMVANYLMYSVVPTKEAFAVATLMTSIAWLILSAIDFPNISFGIRECVYIIVGNSAFLVCACIMKSIIGLVIYVMMIMAITRIFLPEELSSIFSYTAEFVNKKKRLDL